MTLAIVMGVVVPLLLNEFSELAPWLARKILRAAAFFITDPVERIQLRQDWIASAAAVPGKLTKLVAAFSIAVRVVPVQWVRLGFPGGPRHRRRRQLFKLMDDQSVRDLHGLPIPGWPRVWSGGLVIDGCRVEFSVDHGAFDTRQVTWYLPTPEDARSLADMLYRMAQADFDSLLAELQPDPEAIEHAHRRPPIIAPPSN